MLVNIFVVRIIEFDLSQDRLPVLINLKKGRHTPSLRTFVAVPAGWRRAQLWIGPG
jgi:hypothetical protein